MSLRLIDVRRAIDCSATFSCGCRRGAAPVRLSPGRSLRDPEVGRNRAAGSASSRMFAGLSRDESRRFGARTPLSHSARMRCASAPGRRPSTRNRSRATRRERIHHEVPDAAHFTDVCRGESGVRSCAATRASRRNRLATIGRGGKVGPQQLDRDESLERRVRARDRRAIPPRPRGRMISYSARAPSQESPEARDRRRRRRRIRALAGAACGARSDTTSRRARYRPRPARLTMRRARAGGSSIGFREDRLDLPAIAPASHADVRRRARVSQGSTRAVFRRPRRVPGIPVTETSRRMNYQSKEVRAPQFGDRDRRHLAASRSFWNPRAHERILEIGCGRGFLTRESSDSLRRRSASI